jgi:hypothetical protein
LERTGLALIAGEPLEVLFEALFVGSVVEPFVGSSGEFFGGPVEEPLVELFEGPFVVSVEGLFLGSVEESFVEFFEEDFYLTVDFFPVAFSEPLLNSQLDSAYALSEPVSSRSTDQVLPPALQGSV